MNITKARIILGRSATQMTDEQILKIIECFSKIIEVGFQQFEKKNKMKLVRN